ncbi:hypothetical protein AYADHXPP_CDS0141 [Escherichia phage 235Ecol030PP]|nr:hypothetical protein [Shigella flexneri]
MNIRLGSTIPKGYVIDVTTWENDGDNYKTKTLFGVEEHELQQFKYLLKKFKNRHSSTKAKHYCGNTPFSDCSSIIYEYLVEGLFSDQLTPEFIKKVFDIEVDLGNKSEEDEERVFDLFFISGDEVSQGLIDILGHASEYYDYDFLRVVESVEFAYIEEEIVLPTVKMINLL